MEIEYTIRFRKQYRKATKEIKTAFSQALDLFLEDPKHSFLRNHALTKKFVGYRSIDVTGDWRAIFKEKESGKKKVVVFFLLGTHKDLYS